MDLKKAYRGARAALRTAENEAAYILDMLEDIRQCNRELHYDLRDAEARVAELQYLLDHYSERPTKAEALGLGVRAGLAVVALHVLAWYLTALAIW